MPQKAEATTISQPAKLNASAPARTRIIIGIGLSLVICGAAIFIHVAAKRVPGKVPGLNTGVVTTGSHPASQLASVMDVKLLLGPKAAPDRPNVGSVQTYKIDPRLDEATQLRAAGNPAEADRLTHVVVDEWSHARAMSTEIEAEAHRQLGASAYSQYDFDGSIVEYQKAIDIDAVNAKASDFNELGAAFQAKQDFISAIANYSRAIQKDQSYPGAYLNRGNAYLEQMPPNADLAINDYNIAIKLDENSSDAYSNRGNAFALKHDYEHAMADFKEAMRVGPGSARPYNGLGALLFDTGDLGGAIKNYSEAILKDPNLETAWLNRGYARLVMNDAQHAIEDFTSAIGIISKRPKLDKELMASARFGLGTSYNAVAKFQEALTSFEETVTLYPNDAFAHAGLGLAYGGLAKYDKALKFYDQAVKLDGRAFQIYLMRGNLKLAMSGPETAIKDYEEVITLAPDDPGGYLGRGIARAYQNDNRATADLEKAAELGKDTPNGSLAKTWKYVIARDVDHALAAVQPLLAKPNEQDLQLLTAAYWLRARLYASKNMLDDAIADYNNLISLNPATMAFYLARAQLWEKAGKLEQAGKDYDKAIECGPEGPLAYFSRGEFYERQRDNNRSSSDFRIAYSLQRQYYERARSFEDTGDYTRAVQEYSALLSQSPKMVGEAYRARGRAYRGLGDFKGAIADLTTLTTLEPNDVSAWDDRGDTFYASGDYPHAIEDYTMAIRQPGKVGYVYFDRGKAHEALHEYELATADYRRAIAEKLEAPDGALRLYILRAPTDQAAAAKELEENAMTLGSLKRLQSVLELYRGHSSVEDTISFAGDLMCETQYYIGSWYHLRDDDLQTRKAFNQALAICSKADIPYYDVKIAIGELH